MACPEQEVTRFLVDDVTETIAKGTIDRENVLRKQNRTNFI